MKNISQNIIDLILDIHYNTLTPEQESILKNVRIRDFHEEEDMKKKWWKEYEESSRKTRENLKSINLK